MDGENISNIINNLLQGVKPSMPHVEVETLPNADTKRYNIYYVMYHNKPYKPIGFLHDITRT